MPHIIDHLSTEIRAEFATYIETWLAHGLSTEPAQRTAAEGAIKQLYMQQALKQPTII